MTSIDPEQRRVTTDEGTYEADILAVALGADYDRGATPGFEEGGFEYYSVEGAERLCGALPEFESGRIVIGILGQPFKCPPAPFEGALLLHDHLTERGIRDGTEIRVVGPMAAPVPVTKEVSQRFLDVLGERAIEYVPKQLVTSLDARTLAAPCSPAAAACRMTCSSECRSTGCPRWSRARGSPSTGGCPSTTANLATRFPGVYAIGDLVALPMAKAGVFAEAAARTVADDIAAHLHGAELEQPYEGAGSCYIEFGGGMVGKVEANFLGGPAPTARLLGPSRELAAEKQAFGATRRERWFGATS